MCPRCGGASRRVHAWYVRRLTNLPVAGRSLVIELRVRCLACQATACPQRTFREQVPELALRFARRTERHHEANDPTWPVLACASRDGQPTYRWPWKVRRSVRAVRAKVDLGWMTPQSWRRTYAAHPRRRDEPD